MTSIIIPYEIYQKICERVNELDKIKQQRELTKEERENYVALVMFLPDPLTAKSTPMPEA